MRRHSISLAALAMFAAAYRLAPGSGVAEPAVSDVAAAEPGPSAAVAEPVYYSGCNEARAAGAAPIYSGQPGYREDMDGDGDGIACEPHRGRSTW